MRKIEALFVRDKNPKLKRIRGLSCLIILLAAAASPSSGAETKVLRGHVPAAVARLTPLHRLAATNQMSLSIGLPLRDRAGLTNLLREVYDPTSLQYRHYVTSAQFTVH